MPKNSQTNRMNAKKNFISINEGFICGKCGYRNTKLQGSCRNHCTECLYSMHVDEKVPGDRASSCKGLMEPVEVDYKGNKGYIIIHKCEKCHKTVQNKAAEDDNFDAIIKMTKYKKI